METLSTSADRIGAARSWLGLEICSCIDLLVKAGYEENEAAQTLMHRIVIAGGSAAAARLRCAGMAPALGMAQPDCTGVGPEEAKLEYQASSKRAPADARDDAGI
jgi:hypothetical protein